MPRYKTLKQIMRQSSFSGADVGKAIILNWIEYLINNEWLFDNAYKDYLMSNMKQSKKEFVTLNTYTSLLTFSQHFQTMIQANFQQYRRGMEGLQSRYKDLSSRYKTYHIFLMQHLTLTEKEYAKIKAKAHRAYRKTELTDSELVKKYFEDTEPKTMKEFIMKHKAQRGIAVYAYEPAKNIDKQQTELFSKTSFTDAKNFEEKKPETYISRFIDPALNSILGLNALYDLYSEIFKVDLAPLKIKYDFKNDFDQYNIKLELMLSSLYGTQERQELDRQNITQIFPFLDLSKYSKEKTLTEIREELKSENLSAALDPEYMSRLLQGGSIRV